jgi:hypothetical protein
MLVEDIYNNLDSQLDSIEMVQEIVRQSLLIRKIPCLDSNFEQRMIAMDKKLETILQLLCANSSSKEPLDATERSVYVLPSQFSEALVCCAHRKESSMDGISRSKSTGDEQTCRYCLYTDIADISTKSLMHNGESRRQISNARPSVRANKVDRDPGETALQTSSKNDLEHVVAADDAQSGTERATARHQGTNGTDTDRRAPIDFSRRSTECKAPPPTTAPAPAAPSIPWSRQPSAVYPRPPPPVDSGSEEIEEGQAGGAMADRLKRLSVMAGVVTGLKYGGGDDDVEEEARDGWAGLGVAGWGSPGRAPLGVGVGHGC